MNTCKEKASEDPSGVIVSKSHLEICKLETEVYTEREKLIAFLETDSSIADSFAGDMDKVRDN